MKKSEIIRMSVVGLLLSAGIVLATYTPTSVDTMGSAYNRTVKNNLAANFTDIAAELADLTDGSGTLSVNSLTTDTFVINSYVKAIEDTEALPPNGASFVVLFPISAEAGVTNTFTLPSYDAGHVLTIVVSASATNEVRLADTGTIYLAGDWVGNVGDSIVVQSIASGSWAELSRSNN